ncbi:MAG: hypothetical protein ACTTH8_00230 [Treponema sp.]
MIQNIIAILFIAAALFFLFKHFYGVFSGKKSACNCGTKHYTIKNGKLTEGKTCGSCCSCCSNNKKHKNA